MSDQNLGSPSVLPHHAHPIYKDKELAEWSHETLSDEILIVIALTILSNFLSNIVFKVTTRSRAKSRSVVSSSVEIPLISDNAICLLVGIAVGLLILFPNQNLLPAFIFDKCQRALQTMEDPEPIAELVLIFEVLILPVIVYQSWNITSNTLNRSGSAMALVSVSLVANFTASFLFFSIFKACGVFEAVLTDSFEKGAMIDKLIFLCILQLNDFSGSIFPYLEAAIKDQESS